MNLFEPLNSEASKILNSIPGLIEKTFPMPGRFRSCLPKDVADLSHLLTCERGERSLSYLSRPNFQSAYIRYFMPWNIFRLCRLLPALEIKLRSGDTILDLGSGPLTFALALWISRPELRNIPLELHCVDRTGSVLDAGGKIFSALTRSACPWKIVCIKGDVIIRGKPGIVKFSGTGKNNYAAGKKHIIINEKPADFVCAVNMFNEMYQDIPHSNSRVLERAAFNSALLLDSIAARSASILVVEPGTPRSGEFISMLREALISKNRTPVSPCTHCARCPLSGGSRGNVKKRWCHFPFKTDDAPFALHKLSNAAGIPKERAVLSFLFIGNKSSRQIPQKQPLNRQVPGTEPFPVRIISDAFPLPQLKSESHSRQMGRYGCSKLGLVLVTGRRAENAYPGTVVNVDHLGQRDPKSGALIGEISNE